MPVMAYDTATYISPVVSVEYLSLENISFFSFTYIITYWPGHGSTLHRGCLVSMSASELADTQSYRLNLCGPPQFICEILKPSDIWR